MRPRSKGGPDTVGLKFFTPKSVSTVSATATAAATSQHVVVFRKYPIATFHVVMQSLNKLFAPGGKLRPVGRVDKHVHVFEAMVAKTVVLGIG